MYAFNVKTVATALLLGMGAVLSATPASAIVTSTSYDYTIVNGSFSTTFDPTITGTIDVSTNPDTVTSADVVVGGGFGTFTHVVSYSSFSNQEVVTLSNSNYDLVLLLDDTTTLFNGSGATIDSNSYLTPAYCGGNIFCATGNDFTGTLSVSAVPETSTWAMMILGFAVIGFAGYRRSRSALVAA